MEERGHLSEMIKALEALKKASRDIEAMGGGGGGSDGGRCDSPSIKALLELQTGSDDLLSGDPQLSTLSGLLSRFKSLVSSLKSSSSPDGGSGTSGILGSILRRRSGSCDEIARVAGSIGAEIQSWIDRVSADRLVSALRSSSAADARDEEERAALLRALELRVSQGFDRALQEVLLRYGAFGAVEAALADTSAPKLVRERAAATVLALVRFNKAVFVGPVLMGPTVDALVSMSSASAAALRVLSGLIRAIRSPLVDELHARGAIPRLVALLGGGEGSGVDIEVRVLALDCALEIGYFGRKEAIDAMLAEGLVKRLAALQRSDLGGALIEMDCGDGGGVPAGWLCRGRGRGRRRGWEEEQRFLDARPFASCVARWAVQVEVGEGLRQRERRELKRELVARVREAAASEAEAATILAEVLWGSTIW
ncbi:hypothetical protein Cni_G29108 [Canna indica]|uniref:ARM repeat superfamily protein n=1 Tax=Canna indica TaxID=4628 RepID=A0AAQ3L4K6_9LILI|nr:hypothetical protein Cni_G29108 [Canna indica]